MPRKVSDATSYNEELRGRSRKTWIDWGEDSAPEKFTSQTPETESTGTLRRRKPWLALDCNGMNLPCDVLRVGWRANDRIMHYVQWYLTIFLQFSAHFAYFGERTTARRVTDALRSNKSDAKYIKDTALLICLPIVHLCCCMITRFHQMFRSSNSLILAHTFAILFLFAIAYQPESCTKTKKTKREHWMTPLQKSCWPFSGGTKFIYEVSPEMILTIFEIVKCRFDVCSTRCTTPPKVQCTHMHLKCIRSERKQKWRKKKS